MNPFFQALQYVCQPVPLLLLMLGTALGVIVGAIPGLTGAMLIALTLPLTFGMAEKEALILLVSMYVGSISGGLVTATLMRMPGTPASIMTTLDGYPMAKKGKPGRALGLGVSASFIGGMVSFVFLVLLARPMADISVQLGFFDLFSLVLMALVLIASVSGESLLKGILSGFLGMLVTIPGTSPATGQLRWTFGLTELSDGFSLLPVLIGLFAVNQILWDILHIDEKGEQIGISAFRGMFLKLNDWKRHSVNMLRSSLIGTWIGILPGIGANIASVLAYTAARGASKQSAEFGHGSEEGIVASEAANNATVGGALVPLISLGIPGSVIDAILLGALIIHGLQPGPLLFQERPDIVYVIMAAFLVANFFMFVFMMMSLRCLPFLLDAIPEFVLSAILCGFLALVFVVFGRFQWNADWITSDEPFFLGIPVGIVASFLSLFTTLFGKFDVWVILIMADITLFVFLFRRQLKPFLQFMTRHTDVRRELLFPVLLCFCVIGSYALANRMFDVWVMLAFGLIGFAMERWKFPLAPFVIGLVLAPLAEKYLCAGLMKSNGSYWPIVTEPVSLVFFLISLAILFWSLWRTIRKPTSTESQG